MTRAKTHGSVPIRIPVIEVAMKARKKQSVREIAQLAANWTIKKYGKRDASYMLNETAEVEEGYISTYYPFLTCEQVDSVMKLAGKLLEKR